MIKTTAMLIDEYKNYSNPAAKIDRMVQHGELTQIIRGLYSTDTQIPSHCLAPMIYGPSYLSFDYALSYHSLIPEGVRQYTSATYRKRRTKEYHTPFGIFSYRDIPAAAYPYGIEYHVENGYAWQIASAEKSLCDKLYTITPLRNRKELEALLFEDLRIEPSDFHNLDSAGLHELAILYPSTNHKLLRAYLRKGIRHAADHN